MIVSSLLFFFYFNFERCLQTNICKNKTIKH